MARKPRDIGCQACGNEQPPNEGLQLDCACFYCDMCLENMFALAMKDEEAYPPRCCFGTITLQKAKIRLPEPLVNEYNRKLVEMTTKNKTYCANNKCNSFIAPHSIHNNQAHCQKCKRKTCAMCKEPSHFGPCTSETQKVLAALAKEYRWQKCPDCLRMVEKDDGCNHIM